MQVNTSDIGKATRMLKPMKLNRLPALKDLVTVTPPTPSAQPALPVQPEQECQPMEVETSGSSSSSSSKLVKASQAAKTTSMCTGDKDVIQIKELTVDKNQDSLKVRATRQSGSYHRLKNIILLTK